jgi:hypothetical protein
MSKVTIIDKSEITERQSNGGLFQQGIFKIGDSKFQIYIKTDSYNSQSEAKLSKWTETNGFSVIKSSNLLSEYGENPTHKEPRNVVDFFDKVWDKLEKLAKEFV